MPENNNFASPIDQAYDTMLKVADNIASTNANLDIKNIAAMVDKFKDQVLKAEEYYDQEVDPEVAKTEIPENIDIPTSSEGVSVYDPKTGTTIANEVDIKNYKKDITSRHFDALINGNNTEIDVNTLKKMDLLGNDIKKDADIVHIAYLMSKRINGENIKYDDLPNSMKNIVSQIMASVNTRGIKAANMMNKNQVAKMLIDDLVEEYKKDNTTNMDLDTVLAGFDEEVAKVTNEMSSELGGMMLGFDDERKLEIEAAIKRCEESGNTDGVEKLNILKQAMEDVFTLDKFKEFCKACKIKKFDLKKPNRYFDPFNWKYENHTNVINDIKSCPAILDRHHISDYHHLSVALCVAFCKYCENMSPDNIADHTFMYYFIRNIIVLDRINPRGEMYETLDDRSKEFYDKIFSNLGDCINNLIERNKFLDSLETEV